MRLWAAARCQPRGMNVTPINSVGEPASSTPQTGRTDNPYCLEQKPYSLGVGAPRRRPKAERVRDTRFSEGEGFMADTATTAPGEGTLESQLESMLEIEKFEPSEDFRKHALLSDESVYEEAEGDYKAWWTEQAKQLHWFKEPTEILDDSNPPFYKWFADGKINASY